MSTLTRSAASLADNRKVVATAGTREKLSTDDSRIVSVSVQAELNNTGVVVYGGSTVVAAEATRRGIALTAGATAHIAVAQLSAVWLDVTVNGDGVTYVVEEI